MARVDEDGGQGVADQRMLASIPTPSGVRLIKSKYVYKLKKDWRGVVTKRKSRLVCQGFLQREGIDFNETYAPVAKATTFRL